MPDGARAGRGLTALGFMDGLMVFYWLRFAGLAGLLVFAIFQARRGALRGGPGDQGKRITYATLIFALGFALYLGLLAIFLAPLLILTIAFVTGIWVAIPALLSVAVVDVGAKLLQAKRTGFWLGAGVIAFVAITFVWIGAVGGGAISLSLGFWEEYLAIASIPASAALIWWSFLPGGAGESDISKTFD